MNFKKLEPHKSYTLVTDLPIDKVRKLIDKNININYDYMNEPLFNLFNTKRFNGYIENDTLEIKRSVRTKNVDRLYVVSSLLKVAKLILL